MPLADSPVATPVLLSVGGHLVALAALVGLIAALYACRVVAVEHGRTKRIDG